MSIKYPVEGMTANRLYQINQEGKAGFFPIGIHNFWHGGVNLTLGDDDDLSIRAVAKGKIIAYRFTQEYCELSETYPDGEEDKKYYEKDYSHNFVLIKHKHEPENSPPLEYYSLYMHLAPFKIYDEKYDKNKVSIFKRWKCFINTQKDGNGGNLRDRAGNKIGVIPQGAVVTQTTDSDSPEGYINNTKATNYIYVTSAFGNGYISEKVCLENISSNTYRCKVNGGQSDAAKKGLNVYESTSPATAVVAVLPKNTEFYFEEPYHYISKNGQIGSGMAKIKTSLNESSIGYIQVNSTNIRKGEKVLDPVLSDSAQTCEVDVHAGEILGWPGSDGVADKNSFHFEIFTKNDALFGSSGFWTITTEQGKPDSVYKILKDTPMSRMKPNQPISGKTIAKNTILELMEGVDSYGTFPKANARKVKIVQSESKEGWFLHSELSWQGNIKKYYYVSGDVIEWMWLTKPTTSSALTAATRDEFVGLGKTFADNCLEFRFLEKGEVDDTNIRKVSFTTPNPNQNFQGWVKDESKLVGGIYMESGTKKKRYYVAEELTEVYTKNPEYAEFAPSSISTKRDVYVNKKDCPIARDLNEDTWIGFPRAFLESGEIFFDKDEFDEIDRWLWLKEDHGSLQTVNPFDWDEFFEKCMETDVALGEDGFCDAGRIYELVDANYSGEFEASEYRSMVANDSFKQQLRQILVEHPSEWFLPSGDAMNDKWGKRLQAPPFDPTKSRVSTIQDAFIKNSRKPPRFGFNFSPEKYTAFKEIVTKTCFLHQVDGFTEDEKLWYFHPIAFVQHLKRLFSGGYYAEYTEESLTIFTPEGSTTYKVNEYDLVRFPESGRGTSRYGQGYVDTYSIPDMPEKGNGAHGDNWVTPKFAAAVYNAVQEYIDSNPIYANDVPLCYNDFSAYDPDVNLGHTTHDEGNDVDCRYMDSNGQPTNNYQNADVNRMKEFVKKLKEKGCTRIYSDGGNTFIEGTTNASGHSDHLHAGWAS